MPQLGKMRVENFMSLGEADFDFDSAGFVLVEGLNGAGKSAMVDALLWCLYGKTLRGYEHDEVVHRRRAAEGCIVTLDFEVDGEGYRVSRARRHPKLKSSLLLSTQGADASRSSEKETQLEIEHLLGCSYKTFLACVVFGQDRAYRFSSLTDAEQKKILDEVLGVERFATACAAARRRASETQAELASARRSLEKAEEARDEAEVDAIDLQVKHVDFEASQREKVEAEREKLRAAKDWLNKTRKVANVEALKAAAEDALETLAAAEKRRDKWVGTDAEARSAVAESKAKLDAAVADVEARKAGKASSRCPTCGQRVAQKDADALLAAARAEASELKKGHASWTKIAGEAAATATTCRQEVKDARDAVTSTQKNLNEGIGTEANAKAWRQKRLDHEERVAELEREASPYAELAAKALARHEKHAADADGLDSQITGLEVQLRLTEFWVKAFGASGLRSLLVDTSLPLLNEEAARVSRALTGGAIAVEFSATSEQKSGKVVDRFEVKVDNRHGAGDYAGNSSGERAKVDLCVGLALQRLVASRSSASFNLAVFDEVLDHVDSTAHEAVIEVLSELDKDSVLVVSHDEDLKAWFPAAWRFAKRGDFSMVET